MFGESAVQEATPDVESTSARETQEGVDESRETSKPNTSDTAGDDVPRSNNIDSVGLIEDEEMPTYISLSTLSEDKRVTDTVETTSEQNREDDVEHDAGSEHSMHSGSTEPNLRIKSHNQNNEREIEDEEEEDDDDDDGSSVQLLSGDPSITGEDFRDSDEYMSNYSSSDERAQEFICKSQEEGDDESEEYEMENDDQEVMDVGMEGVNLPVGQYPERASSADVEERHGEINRLDRWSRSKSRSLQDLNPSPRSKSSSPKKQFANHQPFSNHDIEIKRSQRRSNPYENIQSKVKQYIHDIKQLGRKSLEQRQKSEERRTVENRKEELNAINQQCHQQISNDHQEEHPLSKIVEVNSATYADIKEANRQRIQQRETEYDRANSGHEKTFTTMTPVVFDNEPDRKKTTDGKQPKVQNMEIEIDVSPGKSKSTIWQNNVADSISMNGSKRLQNGQQDEPVFLKACSLSYEEYMKFGSRPSNSSQLERVLAENAALKRELDSLRHLREALMRSEAEKSSLKKELEKSESEKCALRKSLEKTESEKASLESRAREIELRMRKSESHSYQDNVRNHESVQRIHQNDARAREKEMRTVAVQTEPEKIENSALSSISRWSQSVTSLPESSSGTPSRPRRMISHEFVTSSRILETLSSITRGLQSEQRQPSQPASQIQSHPKQTPLNTPNPKKRKASEVDAGESSQPFKIPNLRRSATNEEMQKEEAEDGFVDGIKCFVYKEDENSSEHSFLIQARDVTKVNGTEGLGDVKRECGPYLIGNVEVRMTEVNGTMHIYGKEVRQLSPQMSVESIPSNNVTTAPIDQQTPRTRHSPGRPMTCSTEKRTAVEARSRLNFERTSCAHRCHEPAQRCRSVADYSNWHSRAPCCQHICACACATTTCRRICCNYVERCSFAENECACTHRSCRPPPPPPPRNCERCNHWQKPIIERDKKDEEEKEHWDGLEERGFCCSKSSNLWQQRYSDSTIVKGDSGVSSDCRTPNQEETSRGEHTRLVTESNEVRKRRLTGKRVRGVIMDLLKGCGDCRAPPASASVANYDSTYALRHIPEIVVTPDESSAPASSAGKKCEMVVDMDEQLECIRVEMDKLRSRSNAILKMLKIHCSESTGN